MQYMTQMATAVKVIPVEPIRKTSREKGKWKVIETILYTHIQSMDNLTQNIWFNWHHLIEDINIHIKIFRHWVWPLSNCTPVKLQTGKSEIK